jgi:hypothetical protein
MNTDMFNKIAEIRKQRPDLDVIIASQSHGEEGRVAGRTLVEKDDYALTETVSVSVEQWLHRVPPALMGHCVVIDGARLYMSTGENALGLYNTVQRCEPMVRLFAHTVFEELCKHATSTIYQVIRFSTLDKAVLQRVGITEEEFNSRCSSEVGDIWNYSDFEGWYSAKVTPYYKEVIMVRVKEKQRSATVQDHGIHS